MIMEKWQMMEDEEKIMEVVMGEIGKKRREMDFEMIVKFLILGIFKEKVKELKKYKGMEGLGIYNRKKQIIIYVMVRGMMLIREGRKIEVL